MNIPTDAGREKTDKIQHPFIIKILKKLGIDIMYLNTIIGHI